MKPIIFLAFANDKVDNARYLRNLPLELDGIRKVLQPAVKEGLCEVIERANVSIEQIFDIFQTYKERIAIFHYGGHADGYQLLLESYQPAATTQHQVAHGEGLVSFFARQKGLRLVFFNGCSTQQQSLELVKAGIPAVIGTSNSINDDIATALSIRFYSGLAKGASLEKAWLEATDEVKMKEGTANLRGLYRKSQTETAPDRFPWEISFREGAEKVKEWNLPEEVDNPLFGLPPVPSTFALPESPFLFLKRYERPHAELFFGRSFYVRDLYNKIVDTLSPPVILLYGQSGTGKSSLFDAGLNPRLENSHQVVYLRRNQNLGLIGTLAEGLALENQGQIPAKKEKYTEENHKEGTQDKRLLLLENLKNHLLTLAESEKINLSATIETLERELSSSFSEEKKYQTDKNFDSSKKFDAAMEQRFLAQVGETPFLSLLKAWHKAENYFQKPLLVILDQAEELFTRPNRQINNELDDLAQCLKVIFNFSVFAPQGKLILGYRKEYHPEFEERFKEYAIPRAKVFLEPLSRKDILDIFKGLTETPALKKRYNLQVDKNLPVIIADDLLEDKDSPVAPVLQILLTKMWDKVRDMQNPTFTVELYQNLKREGFLLDDFFRQQSKKLAEWNPELESSGLPLDILFFHTTHLGTAGSRNLDEIRKHYAHIPEKAELLLYKLKDLYLLVEAGENRTNLTHDTLAPLVKNEFRKSERAGQRASRILENQLNDFLINNKHVLDELEVEIVEKGKEGMRVWTEKEEKFVMASQEVRLEKEKARRRRRRYGIAALSIILITALFSLYQWNQSVKSADSAKMKELMLLSAQNVNSEIDSVKDLAIRLAEQAAIFAEQVENKEKSEVFENFRKVSESYRTHKAEGRFWLPPYQEIRYREKPFDARFSQNKMGDASFLAFRRSSAEFGEMMEDLPDFPQEIYDYTNQIAYKNTLDNQQLIVWIKNHSFRIYPYKRGEASQLFKADSSWTDFLAVDSTRWFVIDTAYQLKAFHPRKRSANLVLTLPKDSISGTYKFQFLSYQNNALFIWFANKLLKISPKKIANDTLKWENVSVDTLAKVTDDNPASSDFYTTNYELAWYAYGSAGVAVSQDLSRIVAYTNKKAVLLHKSNQDSTYRLLPISDFTTYGDYYSSVSFSKDLQYVGIINRSNNFSLYRLQIKNDKVVLSEVFNRSIRVNNSTVTNIALSQDNTNHILVRLVEQKRNTEQARSANQVRIYDFKGQLDDIHYLSDETMRFSFSDDGNYLIDLQENKIVLRFPIYHLKNWLERTTAPLLTVRQKINYDIASFREKWQQYDAQKFILAQIVSFMTILLILIRYIPVGIHLYKEKRYYKIFMYGLATFIFLIAAIYREFFTEMEENIINKLADNFIILAFFYLCLILFEQREEIRNYVLEKKWASLALYTAPELIVMLINVYAIYQLFVYGNLQDYEVLVEKGYFYIFLPMFYIFNALVLWTIHLSETSFHQKKYIKTLGLLFFAYGYLSWFLTQYTTPDRLDLFTWGIAVYFFAWFTLWVGEKVYLYYKPLTEILVAKRKWVALVINLLPELLLFVFFSLMLYFTLAESGNGSDKWIVAYFLFLCFIFLLWIVTIGKKTLGKIRNRKA
jgi:hypothetical protein